MHFLKNSEVILEVAAVISGVDAVINLIQRSKRGAIFLNRGVIFLTVVLYFLTVGHQF